MPKQKKPGKYRVPPRKDRHGLIIVNTGDGKGKTTAALGLLVRAAGHDLRIGMFQFIKSAETRYGEHIAARRLGVDIIPLGDGFTWLSENIAEDRALKKKKFDSAAFKDGGAPIEALDRISRRLIWIGFPIFTVALVLGAIWTSQLGQGLGHIEYVLAAVTWLAYATLLVARQIYGWRGRRAARLTLEGFATALAVLVIYLIKRMTG